MPRIDYVALIKASLLPAAEIRPHHSGFIAHTIAKLLNASGFAADQHQQNSMFGCHQIRLRRPNDPNTYRIIIAPADAPIRIGQCDADLHFAEPIGREG